MSKCSEYQELISAYVDSELDDSDAIRVEKHLETCESCSAILRLYRVISAISQESLVEAPATLRDGVMKNIRNEGVVHIGDHAKKRRIVRRVLTRYVPIAACLAAILLTLPRVIDLSRSADNMATDKMFSPSASGTTGSSVNAETAPRAPSSNGSDMDAVETEPDGGTVYATAQDAVGGNNQSDAYYGAVDDNSYPEGDAPMPEPMPAPSSENPMNSETPDALLAAGDDSGGDGLRDEPYYAIIEISGELPASLADYIALFVDDLTLHYFIPRGAVQDLIEELAGRTDVTVSAMNLSGDVALVIYSRQSH